MILNSPSAESSSAPSKLKNLYLDYKALDVFANLQEQGRDTREALLQQLGFETLELYETHFGDLIKHFKRCQASENLLRICLKNNAPTLDSMLDEDQTHFSEKKVNKIKSLVKIIFNESQEEYEEFHEI